MATKRKSKFSPESFLAKIGAGRSIATYPKNKIIFAQGEACDAMFFIQKGSVKITVLSELGKEAVVAILDENNFVGESCLTGATHRISTATTMGEATIMRLQKKAVEKVIREQPAFAELFLAHLLARNTRIEADLVDQLFNSSEKRLARTLLLLANFGKSEKPETIIAKISQETLAEMIGTTRSRVSFFMNKFRKLGFISYNGSIRVHRALLNAVLHEQPKIERGEKTKSKSGSQAL